MTNQELRKKAEKLNDYAKQFLKEEYDSGIDETLIIDLKKIAKFCVKMANYIKGKGSDIDEIVSLHNDLKTIADDSLYIAGRIRDVLDGRY